MADGGALFSFEEEFLQALLDRVQTKDGYLPPDREELANFAAQYKKLLKNSKRLVSLSDRMQKELNDLNSEILISEEKYRNIFEGATEGIFQATPEGVLISANPALAKIFGYSSTESILEADTWPLLEGDLWQAILAGGDQEVCGHQHECRITLRSGNEIWIHIRSAAVRDKEGNLSRIDGLISDVTERKALEDKLKHHAMVDGLTGLFNRRHFEVLLSNEVARVKRHKIPMSMLVMDIDHFKKINDTYGHYVGDRVLVGFAKTIRKNMRAEDTVGRIGGEEFCVLIPNVGVKGGMAAAENLRKAVEESKAVVDDATITYTISIGVVEFSEEANSPLTLFKAADEALYKAKNSGRNRVVAAF